MKGSLRIIATHAALACVLSIGGAALLSVHAQTPTPTPEPAEKVTQTEQQSRSVIASTAAEHLTPREKREQAYAKLLEGQSYLSNLRRSNVETNVRLARQSFQQAAALDPTLAEAHTALAELAFFYPPYDFDQSATEALAATRIDRNNFGAQRLLARIYSIKSGLRENNLNKTFVEKAVASWQEVARLDPNNAEGWALLGEFYQATGRTDDAINAFTRAAAAPPSTDTRFYQVITNGRELSPDASAARLGEALLGAGRTTEAIVAIRRAMSLNPDNKQYVELLTQAFDAGGSAGDTNSITELQRLVAADPENAALLALLARAQARSGRLDDATMTLKTAISGRKDADEKLTLRVSLAEIYADAFRNADAIGVYEELLRDRGITDAPLTDPQEKDFASKVLRRIIFLQKNAGRTNDVAATIERMRRLLGRDDPTADVQAIELLREQGKRREALAAIRAARQRYPDQTAFVELEVDALADLGQVEQAVALLRGRLNGSVEEDFRTYLRLSNIYSQAKRGREAIEAARKALNLAPDGRQDMLSAGLIMLSSAQERAGDFKGSEESLRRVLASEPNNATALNNLGYFLIERNERLDEALGLIQRAVKVEPTNSSFLDSLGWAYFKLGKLDAAERFLSEATRRDSTSSTTQEHLGDVYQRQGKNDQARAAWQRALVLSVADDDIARIKSKLNLRIRK